VVPDEIARARITLESALPAESLSKEVDGATLSVVGYPAFAIEDEELVNRTVGSVVDKLEGRYGCKRFLRDGHQTVVEDPHRLHYEPEELRQFEHIECEWPLFFTYLLLHHLFTGNEGMARLYREKIEAVLVEHNGNQLLPELYIVPEDKIDAEREAPQSQNRVPNENLPLVWAQSLYILGALIQDGLLGVEDVDPIGRRLRIGRRLGRRVQLALIAHDRAVQQQLEAHGIVAETLEQVAPVTIHQADALADAYLQIGRNDRLGLSGRPLRHLRGLATSSIYSLARQRMVFQPQFMNRRDFYLTLDNRMLVERFKMELAYVASQWDAPGRPVVVLVVDHTMLGVDGSQALLEFMEECQQGSVGDVPVQVGRLGEFLPTAGRERIDFLHNHHFLEQSLEPNERRCFIVLPMPSGESEEDMPSFDESKNDQQLIGLLSGCGSPGLQVECLGELVRRHGLDFDTGLTDIGGQTCTVRELLEELYIRAGYMRDWTVVRLCAGLLEMHDIDLEGAATEILVRGKGLSLARSYSRRSTIRRPTSAREIIKIIREYNPEDLRAQILTQELVLILGLFMRSEPDLLRDMGTVRVGHILQLIAAKMRDDRGVFVHRALDSIMAMAPHELARELREALMHYQDAQEVLYRLESMRVEP
ncbi:MAG: glycoside hydrolase family 15 protein, partial [Gammaproteobacteria bacterium]